jgi:hypothetical protein
MGLRAGHLGSIKMIMTNILVRSTSSSAYVHHNIFGCINNRGMDVCGYFLNK